MFKYKQCEVCGIKNKKHYKHCINCGGSLENVLKTSTKSVVIFLTALIFLCGTAVYASYSLYGFKINKHDNQNSVQKTQVPTTLNKSPETIAEPDKKQETSGSKESNNTPSTEGLTSVTNTIPASTPATAPATSPTQTTPPATVEPAKVCVLDQETIDFNNKLRIIEINDSDSFYNSQITHIYAVATDSGMGLSSFYSNQIDQLKREMEAARQSINSRWDQAIQNIPQICS